MSICRIIVAGVFRVYVFSHRLIKSRVSTYRVGLSCNQKVVGSSHDVHASLAPVGMSYQVSYYYSSKYLQVFMTDDYLLLLEHVYSFQAVWKEGTRVDLPGQFQINFVMFCDLSRWCLQLYCLTIKFYLTTNLII